MKNITKRGHEKILKEWFKIHLMKLDTIQIDISPYIGKKNVTMKDFDSIHDQLMKLGDDLNDLTMVFNRFKRVFEKNLK